MSQSLVTVVLQPAARMGRAAINGCNGAGAAFAHAAPLRRPGQERARA